METPQESLDELRGEIAELRASRERLATAADADRRSIERELHDGPQQQLVAIAVNLQLARDLVEADPAAAKALLEQLGADAQRALAETANLAQRIYPPLLDAGGLGVALRGAAESTGVRADIHVSGVEGVPPEIAGAVYFCCLDLLERAGAGAETTIDVRAADGELVFEVAADGDENVQQTVASSSGRLADRVEALGGRLSVDAAPGHEVRISGSLPV